MMVTALITPVTPATDVVAMAIIAAKNHGTWRPYDNGSAAAINVADTTGK